MKKKSLVLITSQSLNKWNHSRFNLSYLKKNFYVKYWNISPITSSVSLIKKEKNQEITVKEKKFFSYFELIKAINNNVLAYKYQLKRLLKISYLL